MAKETITNRQGFALLVTFTMCNCFSTLFGTDCGRDIWIAHLIASCLSILIWALLVTSFERYGFTSFFDMLDCAFGKVAGRIITFLLAVYAVLSCATSIGLFSRFTQLTALSKTPQIILPLLLLMLSAWALKSGLEAVARSAGLIFYFATLTFICFLLFGIPFIDARNISPILENGILPPTRHALTVFTNQFGDTLFLLAVYPSILRTPKRKKTMIWAMVTVAAAISLIALSTVLTLGGEQLRAEFFPVFTTLSIRNIGGFIQHLEILTSTVTTFFVFIRQTVILYFVTTAISHIFNTSAYQRFLTPIALIIASGTQLFYWNMMSLRQRLEGDLNLYILLPLQLLLPCVLCALLIKRRRLNAK